MVIGGYMWTYLKYLQAGMGQSYPTESSLCFTCPHIIMHSLETHLTGSCSVLFLSTLHNRRTLTQCQSLMLTQNRAPHICLSREQIEPPCHCQAFYVLVANTYSDFSCCLFHEMMESSFLVSPAASYLSTHINGSNS